MRSHKKIALLLAAMLMLTLAVFALASCGGDGDNGTTPAATTTATPSYVITFDVNGVTTTQTVLKGETPVFTGSTDKASTAEKVYTFKGWDKEIVAATANATYTATYDEAAREYEITFIVNGVETKVSVAYGTVPAFTGSTDKASDSDKDYTFAGWDKDLAAVTGDATYTATYTDSVRKYDITFRIDGKDRVVQVPKGTVPTFEGTPTKAPDDNYNYTFTKWDNELVAVTGDATYVAEFSTSTRTYTITFSVDGNNTVSTVEKGTVPTFEGTPAKAEDAKSYYIFTGWDKEIVAAAADTTYTAKFFAPVLLNKTFTGNTISAENKTVADAEYSKLSYGANGKEMTFKSVVSGDNTYLEAFFPAGSSDPAINFSPDGGVAKQIGEYTSLLYTVKLSKKGDLGIPSTMFRVRGTGGSSDTVNLFQFDTTNGNVYLGTNKEAIIGTLTDAFQTFAVKIDFAEGMLTGYLNGTQICTTAFTVPSGQKTGLESPTTLDWLHSLTGGMAINWYLSAGKAAVDKALLIDDFRIEIAIPTTPAE